MRVFLAVAFAGLLLGACAFNPLNWNPFKWYEDNCPAWFGEGWWCEVEYARDDRMDMLSHDHEGQPDKPEQSEPEPEPDKNKKDKKDKGKKDKGKSKGKSKGHAKY